MCAEPGSLGVLMRYPARAALHTARKLVHNDHRVSAARPIAFVTTPGREVLSVGV
jgi:hypothetical protein